MNWLENTEQIVVDPTEVDLRDRTYWIPSFLGTDELARSIAAVGIVNPPLLQVTSSGRMIPVLGRRRLEAALNTGLHDVKARMAPESMTEADGFLLALWDNFGHRKFDPATTAVVVAKLLEFFPREAVARDFLPLLGVPPRGPKLEALRIVARLEDRGLRLLAAGRLHEKTAVLLCRMSKADRGRALDLMEDLGANANKSAEIAGNLYDLSILRGRSVSEILAEEQVVRILSDDKLHPAARAERVRALLRNWKVPELVRNEEEFHSWVQALVLPPNVSVQHSQAFESPACTVQIQAQSRDEAQRVLDKLLGPDPATGAKARGK